MVIRPVFAFPSAPDGWVGPTARLIRIIDPAGDAIAWLDSEAGTCAGYAVREAHPEGTSWHHILVGIPAAAEQDSGGRWSLVERDPASCTLAPERQAGDVPISMTASIDDGILSLSYWLPSSPSRSPFTLTLACTTPPLLHGISPGGNLDDEPGPLARERSVIISHDGGFVVASIRAMTSPGGRALSVVTLKSLPRTADASPGRVQEHLVRIGKPSTQPI